MLKITSGSTHGLADAEAFIDQLQRLDEHPYGAARSLFSANTPIHIGRAPGRLDLMGGIADYSGALALQWPLAEAAIVAVQHRTDRIVRIVRTAADHSRSQHVELDLGHVIGDYAKVGEALRAAPRNHWCASIAGCLTVLAREESVAFPTGFDILIDSKVPEGRGVSSSAAKAVATMHALAAACKVDLDGRSIALLCQQVENFVVGSPCGIMGQMVSSCGEQGKLLAILCQPAELIGTIDLPDELAIWGIDSGVQHKSGTGDYEAVRIGAFMGYRILAQRAGLPANSNAGVTAIDDERWLGYLANIRPHEFLAFKHHLPEHIDGGEFMRTFKGLTDPVTVVNEARSYPVRAPTAHPIFEHHRVQCFAELIAAPDSPRRNKVLGEMMFQSHASYSTCGLGSDGTDALVDAVDAPGNLSKGLYGAKITGGGSGGVVAVLGRSDAGRSIDSLAYAYTADRGIKPHVFTGSSPGAAAFGTITLE